MKEAVELLEMQQRRGGKEKGGARQIKLEAETDPEGSLCVSQCS